MLNPKKSCEKNEDTILGFLRLVMLTHKTPKKTENRQWELISLKRKGRANERKNIRTRLEAVNDGRIQGKKSCDKNAKKDVGRTSGLSCDQYGRA